MGRGQEGGEGLARHHPGGDAEVLGTNGAGEGMRRAGTLAARRVVAPAVEEVAAELLLQDLGQIVCRPLGRAGGPHLLQQGRQLGLQRSKEILQSDFADVWLVRLGQNFPRAALDPLSASQLGRLLAPQPD